MISRADPGLWFMLAVVGFGLAVLVGLALLAVAVSQLLKRRRKEMEDE